MAWAAMAACLPVPSDASADAGADIDRDYWQEPEAYDTACMA
jgi:hypothetical protein